MAIPTVVGVGAVISGAAGITPPYPVGYTAVANDVAFTFIESATGDIITPPTGWVQAVQANVSTGTAPTKLTVLWRRFAGGEAASAIADAGDHMVARMIVLNGCITTGNPWDFATATTELVADTSVSIAAGTTLGANRLILAAFATGQDVASTAGTSTWANATLASVTERTDNWVTTGGGGGFTMMTGTKAVAGSTGACTCTLLLTANFKAQVLIAVIGASSALSATVNQVTNTNTAQAITKLKRKAVGQIVETDAAQTITRRKTRAVGQIVETQTAQTVTRRKTRTIGQVNEINASNAVTELTGQTIVLGIATQTDSPLNVTAKKSRAIGLVTQTNTAQTVNEIKSKAIGLITETDLAQAFTRRKTKTVGQVVQTNTAQALTKLKFKAVGRVTETQIAQAITRRKSRAIGQVTTTDTASAIARSKTKVIGQITETQTALSITAPGSPTIVGQIIESGSARTITSRKIKAVSQIVETDVSRALSKLKTRLVGQALSVDVAWQIMGLTVPTVAMVNETDLARQISGGVAPLDIHGWMPLIGKHCIYLKPKTVNGNVTYIKRISVMITAYASDGYPILKSNASGVTYGTASVGIRPRSHPDANEVDVYQSY